MPPLHSLGGTGVCGLAGAGRWNKSRLRPPGRFGIGFTSASVKKLGFDALCLAAVIQEAQCLVGTRLQRILPVGEQGIALGFFGAAGQRETWLYIGWHPENARMHLLSHRPPRQEDLGHLVPGLRAKITDASLVFIRQRGLDRIAELGFATSDGGLQLVAELVGRHAWVILVDQNAKVLAASRFAGAGQTKRPVLPGKPYSPPPGEPRPSILNNPQGDWKQLEGWSPSLQAFLDEGGQRAEVLRCLETGDWRPCLVAGRGPSPLPWPSAQILPSLSKGLEDWYEAKEASQSLERAKTSLRTQLKRVLLARETSLRDLHEAVEAGLGAARLQQEGELILAYQGMIQQGDEALEAYDYAGNPASIKINPELTPVENAERRFTKAKKAKARLTMVTGQEERLNQDKEEILAVLERMELASALDEVQKLKDHADLRKWLHKAHVPLPKEERPYEGHSIRETLSPAGWRVLYGTGPTANDFLTTKVGRPNDWWLHVRGAPSAHVILITNNHPEKVQRPDLMFAAEIAAKNSPAKHSGLVLVDYVLKKHVRKPRKSAPGFATYSQERTLQLELKP